MHVCVCVGQKHSTCVALLLVAKRIQYCPCFLCGRGWCCILAPLLLLPQQLLPLEATNATGPSWRWVWVFTWRERGFGIVKKTHPS